MKINEKITISDFNEQWKYQFEEEKRLIQQSLPNLHIEHIGSTSVKGMIAKPIIDIMVGTKLYPPPDNIIASLEHLGFYSFGEIDAVNGRYYFVKRGKIDCNLHIVLHLGSLWENNIDFRNYLIAYPKSASAYSALKRNLIEQGKDTLLEYSRQKEEMINYIFKKIKTLSKGDSVPRKLKD